MRNCLIGLLLLLLPLASCRHKELSPDDYCGTGDRKILVRVHWDHAASQARVMRINLFSLSPGVNDYGRDEVPAAGEKQLSLVGGASYRLFCYDYNAQNIYFRNEMEAARFEAYFSGASRATYNNYGSPVAGEATYSAPSGGEFYVDAATAPIDIDNDPLHDQVIDCYPKNILRQFTFRINNICGYNYIKDLRGAVSGMASTFRFQDNSPGEERATILFGNIRKGYDAEKEYGYLEGEFFTFAPPAPYKNQFTAELYSTAGKYYGAYWDVSPQVKESMEDREGKLIRDGYDILLWNDREQHIPDIDPGEGASGGGFDIGVGEWGDEVIIELK